MEAIICVPGRSRKDGDQTLRCRYWSTPPVTSQEENVIVRLESNLELT